MGEGAGSDILYQGRVLKGSTPGKFSILVSHDCDIANPGGDEVYYEYIDGKIIPAADGNFTHGKSPRKIHLELNSQDGQKIYVELEAINKASVKRDQLILEFEADYFITTPNLNSLRKWLASRYDRSALPDQFNTWLQGTKIEKYIEDQIKKLGNDLLAVYFDIRNFDEEPQDENNPYDITIYLLYNTTEDPLAVKAKIDDVCTKIKEKFASVCGEGRNIKFFDLDGCIPISENIMSVHDTRILFKWQKDYVSLRALPQQATEASTKRFLRPKSLIEEA